LCHLSEKGIDLGTYSQIPDPTAALPLQPCRPFHPQSLAADFVRQALPFSLYPRSAKAFSQTQWSHLPYRKVIAPWWSRRLHLYGLLYTFCENAGRANTMSPFNCRIVLAVALSGVLPLASSLCAQTAAQPWIHAGQVQIANRSVPYLIRNLPPSAFPLLPSAVRAELDRRSCLIPQTFQAHQPENAIHASLLSPGSSDWAVLCNAAGSITLLVFAEGSSAPLAMAHAAETERLQPHDSTGALGFNWGIDPATPDQVREAQAGLLPRPARLSHDALADSTLERHTLYHYFANGQWTLLATPE